MPLTPVHGHEKIAPRHSRFDGLAQREIVKPLEHLAHLAGLRDDDEFSEDKYRSKAPQDAKNEFEETELTEEMALYSVKQHAEREASRFDEAFQPGDELEIEIRRLTSHGRFENICVHRQPPKPCCTIPPGHQGHQICYRCNHYPNPRNGDVNCFTFAVVDARRPF